MTAIIASLFSMSFAAQSPPIERLSLCKPDFVAVCVSMENPGGGKDVTRIKQNARGTKKDKLTAKQFEAEVGKMFALAKPGPDNSKCSLHLVLTVTSKGSQTTRYICSDDYNDKEWKQWAAFIN